jgi:hypothetical protein
MESLIYNKDLYEKIISYIIPYELLGLVISNNFIYKISKETFKFYDEYENSSCSKCNYLLAWSKQIPIETTNIKKTFNGKQTYFNYYCYDCYYDNNNHYNEYISYNLPNILDRFWYVTVLKINIS